MPSRLGPMRLIGPPRRPLLGATDQTKPSRNQGEALSGIADN